MSLRKLAMHACAVLAIGIGAIAPTTALGDSVACCTPNQGDQSTDPTCIMVAQANLCVAPGEAQAAGSNCDESTLDSDTVAEVCEYLCTNNCVVPTPSVSEWSLIIMTVLAFTAGTILFGRRRRATAA